MAEHTAQPVESTHKVYVEALDRHLFSKGNYPDNIWPIDWAWEGPELAFLCAVQRRSTSRSEAVSDEPAGVY